jgi:glycogen synthase
MPSLYEPFGSANEFYLHGTPGIARATGGLVEQIVPLRAAACYSDAVHAPATVWHAFSARPTGILYREPDTVSTAQRWQSLNEGEYDATGQSPDNDRVAQRSHNPLFAAMARELGLAIADGVRLWRESRDQYWRMLIEGVDYIQRTFSWERAAQEYVRTCGLRLTGGPDVPDAGQTA